jgi:hypothetical protein
MDIQKPNALRLAIHYVQDLCRSHTRFLHRAHPWYPECVRENFETRVSRSTDTATKRVGSRNPLNLRSMETNVLECHSRMCRSSPQLLSDAIQGSSLGHLPISIPKNIAALYFLQSARQPNLTRHGVHTCNFVMWYTNVWTACPVNGWEPWYIIL